MNVLLNKQDSFAISMPLTELKIFLLIIPFVKPDSFRRIPMLDTVFDAWCLVNAVLIFFIALYRLFTGKWKPSRAFAGIFALNAWLQITTLMHIGFNMTPIKSFVMTTAVTLIIDVYIKNYKNLISAFMLTFELLLYSNFVTFIIFPNGMYTDGLYSTNWLMGYDNSQIKFYIFASLIAVAHKNITGNKARGNIMLAVIVMSILFTKVFTAIIGLAIILGVMIFNYRDKLKSIFKPKYYLIFALAAFYIVVIDGFLTDKMDLITKLTGKTETFSSRFEIWRHSVNLILKSLVFGYGWQEVSVRTAEYYNDNATHAHDTYLEYLYQGGIIGFVIFIFVMIIIAKKLSKCSNRNVKQYYSAVFLAFLTMMLVEAYVFPIAYMIYMILYYCDEFDRELSVSRLSKSLGGKT